MASLANPAAMEFITTLARPTAWAVSADEFDPNDPLVTLGPRHSQVASWSGVNSTSLLSLREEVEAGWFRDSHPESWQCWQLLQETFTVVRSSWTGPQSLPGHRLGLSPPEHLQSLLSRPALSDAVDAIEYRCRRRCLDPEVDDLLSLLTFFRRHPGHWMLVACPKAP